MKVPDDPVEALPGRLPDQSPADPRPTHSEDGVGLTLIRCMLSLTPAERLETLQNTIIAQAATPFLVSWLEGAPFPNCANEIVFA
jgi:hypothetical protein